MIRKRINIYLGILISWTVLIVGLTVFEFKKIKEESEKIATAEAHANFNKDQAIRFWAASHGGVYVPVDSNTPPNPALSHIPERDLVTPSGKKLTLMNPAYMVRELNEYFAEFYGVKGHITSKILLRAENKPDEWEFNALNQFEKGEKVVTEFSEIDGELHLRLMEPMIATEACLKCHGHQGYEVGDIRGGVGIAIPMQPIIDHARQHRSRNLVAFLIIWIVGASSLSWGYRKLEKTMQKQRNAELSLQLQNNELNITKTVLQAQNRDYIKMNKELVVAKEKAEDSNRLKSQFINNMSHEIRTPLNGILGFSSLLNKASLSEEIRKRYIEVIHNSGNQLMRIVDEIMEISVLGTRQIDIEEDEVCLNDLLFEIYSNYDDFAKKKKLPLHIKIGLTDKESKILTDKSKLEKIINNFLDNAIKFTKEGLIEFGYQLNTRSEPAEIEIYVQDTGIGIEKEDQEKIFERFYQEDKSPSEIVGGLGLGLSIAKENAELIGGKIHLKSQKGQGSTFFLTLPYNPVMDEPIIEEVVGHEKRTSKKADCFSVLVVEDEEANYLYLKALLEEEMELNLKIHHAANGQKAIEICKEHPEIDIILMDLKMPTLNGFEATKIIKEFRPNLPTVAQTAYSTDEDKKRAISAGCDDFISKPISVDTLKNIVLKHLFVD